MTLNGKVDQIKDIGYLCDLYDPSGLNIELLQHTFESNFDPNKVAAIMDRNKYKDILGMIYLSNQRSDQYGFTLYFLGYDNGDSETMPNPDSLEAVENREWQNMMKLDGKG